MQQYAGTGNEHKPPRNGKQQNAPTGDEMGLTSMHLQGCK
jgi:hypothetical protein